MKNRKVLTEPEVRYYMLQICEGVRYLHKKHILHRDLKLGNMFLTWDMTVKIGDFGLATQHQASLSSASTLCGTPNYIAPEVLRKQGHGYEADIWALGCMMFAMLVGTPPFETKSLGRTYAKIAANEYETPDRLSLSAKGFISMLLNPDPKARGHLQHQGHPSDLLSHPFFMSGLCPRKLPQSAAVVPPILTIETVLSDINSSTSMMDITDSGMPGSPNGSSGSGKAQRSTLRQKFSQMFSNVPASACLQPQGHHNAHMPYIPSSIISQYRPGDQLIGLIIDSLEHWVSRRPSLVANCDAEANALCSPISVVPIFVSKWIDYSNKYGFGYQLSDKTVGVLFNEGTRICQSANSEEVGRPYLAILLKDY